MRAHASKGSFAVKISAAILLVTLVAGLHAAAVPAAVGGSSSSTRAGASGPVAAYSFDDGSGTTLADISGKGNTGTISGPTWTSGRNGGALNFDGVNDWVTVADSASLDLTGDMTLEAWAQPTAIASWPTIATKETTGNLVYGLFASSDTDQAASIITLSNSGEQDIVRGGTILPLGTWTHLAATYNGNRLKLYVNGSQVGSLSAGGSIGTSNQPLRIGGNNVWGEWFQGKLDDLRIYNRALTATQINNDKNTPVGSPPADKQAPSTPTNLRTTTSTATSISLSWDAATDNTGVAGYTVYNAATSVANSSATSYTLSGLACATTYSLAVDAYDAAGNRSAKAQISASTGACPDTSPPTTPTGLAASTPTQTSITVSWTGSSDNVGVTGYGRYSNGALVSSGTGTSYTYTGLTCGTSYTLAVDAYDAAGNRSGKATITKATSACPAAAGPVAAYSFDAGSGTTLADVTGKGNTGTISGPIWTSGRNGGALNFDGVNDWVTVADSSTLDLTNAMTLEAWAQPSALVSWPTIVTKETTGNLVYGLFANSDTDQAASILTLASNGTQDIVRGTNTLPVATWTHLAATYDGSALKLYVNGSQVGSIPVSGLIGTSSQPLRIGGNNIWGEWFQGKLDDLRVYNRALTAAEINTDKNTPVGTVSGGDTQAPTSPANLTVTGTGTGSITLGWSASLDNVGVTGYGHYSNGVLLSDSAGTSYTFTGLTCGTSYTLAVDAYDAGANRSAKAQITAATSACPAGDTTPPTAPANLTVTGTAADSISLSWSASIDNVGVVGYGRYQNGSLLSSAAGTSYTFGGLSCGTTYTLAVDAYDAAGNRSAKAQTIVSTSACPAPLPSSSGANLWVDTTGGTCTRSGSLVAYSDGAACSWQQANAACLGGDTVLVKAGSYGNVIIRGSNGRTSACTIKVASGETVTLGTLELGIWQSCSPGANSSSTTNWLTIVGPLKSREFHADCSNQITVDNLDMDAGRQQITQPFQAQAGTTNFTLRNSKVHDALNPNAMMVLEGSNFTIDNNDIYNDLNNTNGAIHDECLRTQPVQNMKLTRNHFWSCNVMDVFLTGGSGRNLATNWLIENNIFEAPTGSSGNAANAVFVRDGSDAYVVPDGFIVRYNTFGSSGMYLVAGNTTPTSNGAQIHGNYFATNTPCGVPNTSYSYNITPTGVDNCGGTGAQSFAASTINSGFTSYHPYSGNGGSSAEPAGDYHLNATSPLINRANPANYPTLDRDNGSRYKGTAPDAGAYEAG
jgi:chitodextrinase